MRSVRASARACVHVDVVCVVACVICGWSGCPPVWVLAAFIGMRAVCVVFVCERERACMWVLCEWLRVLVACGSGV